VAFSPLAAFTAAHAVTVPISIPISITLNFNSYLSLGIKTVGGQLLDWPRARQGWNGQDREGGSSEKDFHGRLLGFPYRQVPRRP